MNAVREETVSVGVAVSAMMLDEPNEIHARLKQAMAGRVAGHVVALELPDADEKGCQVFQSNSKKVIALSVPNIGDDAYGALVDNLVDLVTLFSERQTSRAIEEITRQLLPPTPVTPHLLKQAAMLAKAKKAVLNSGDWLTSAELSKIAGLETTNPSAQPNKWKRAGKVFAIQHNGADYFPAYALDAEKSYRPLPVMAEIMTIFSGHKNGWGMAFWFMSANGFLGGVTPKSIVATEPERVVAAARDEIEGVVHG